MFLRAFFMVFFRQPSHRSCPSPLESRICTAYWARSSVHVSADLCVHMCMCKYGCMQTCCNNAHTLTSTNRSTTLSTITSTTRSCVTICKEQSMVHVSPRRETATGCRPDPSAAHSGARTQTSEREMAFASPFRLRLLCRRRWAFRLPSP